MQAADVDAQFDRARTRNRAAQCNFRKRLQAQCDAAEEAVRATRQLLLAAQARYAELQRQRVRQSTRNANATSALAEVTAQQRPVAPTTSAMPPLRSPPPQPLPTTSAVSIAARAGLGHGTGTASTAGQQPSSEGTVRQPTALRGVCNPPGTLILGRSSPTALRQPCAQPPPPISSFRGTAGISYADLRAAADPSTRLLDFSRHPLAEVTDRVCVAKAARLGLARGDVCWFVQTSYYAAEGLPLSVSATMSSPECMASFALHFLLSQVELLLVTAAASSMEEHGTCADDLRRASVEAAPGCSRGYGTAVPAARDQPCKAPRLPRATPPHVDDQNNTAGGCVFNTAVPMKVPAPNAVSSGSGCAHAVGQHPTKQHSTATAHSIQGVTSSEWSGQVRCGVNESVEVGCAVHTTLRALVLKFCQEMPLATLCRVLTEHLAVAQRVLSSFATPCSRRECAGGKPNGGGDGDGEDIENFKACSMAAAQGMLRCFIEAEEALADLRVLRQLAEEARAEAADGGQGNQERRMQVQAHSAVAIYALLHSVTLRDAPRLVRSLTPHGIYLSALLSEYDSFHVHLYRRLQLTAEDRQRLITHWTMWSQLCMALNATFHSALSTLAGLPQADEVPKALRVRITNLASGDRRASSFPRDEQNACSTLGSGDTVQEVGGCQLSTGMVVQKLHGAQGRGWDGALRLLGASGCETAAAERGLLALRDVHEAHSRVRRETMELQMQPGVLLRPLQLARLWTAHIPCGTVAADLMKICQLAAQHQRWLRMAAQPPVLQRPMLSCQWLDGAAAATGERQCKGPATVVL